MKAKPCMLVVGLTGLAVAQALALSARGRDFGAARRPPPDFSAFLAEDAAGRKRPLANDGPVLVLVFDPECAHTQRMAPAWSEWLRTAGAGLRVVALSGAPRAAASAYAARAGWRVPVLTAPAGLRGSPEHAAVSRAPWVFALDADGNVVAEGHGSRLSQVAGALGGTRRVVRRSSSLAALDARRNHA